MQPTPILSAKYRFRPVVERLERRLLRAADVLDPCDLACEYGLDSLASATGLSHPATVQGEAAQGEAAQASLQLGTENTTAGIQSPQTVVAGVDPTIHDAWIVALSEGQHGMAYVQQQQGQDQIMFRRTLADGTPGPAAQQVAVVAAQTFPDSTNNFSPVQVRLAARSEGGWVVAWTDGDYLFARAFDANDQAIGQTVEQSVSPANDLYEVALIPNDDGFLLAWSSPSGAIEARAFDENLSETVDSFTLFHPPPGNLIVELDPQIRGPETALQWTVLDSQTMEPISRQWATLPNPGQSITAALEVPAGAFAHPPSIVPLSENRFAVVGTEFSDSGDDLVVRIVSGEGDILREHRFQVNASADSTVESADSSAAALVGGGFVVGYIETDETTLESVFVSQLFNLDGEAAPFTTMVELGYQPTSGGMVKALTNGSYAGYWVDTALDGYSPVIATQTLRPTSTPLVVTFSDPAESIDRNLSTLEIQGVPADALLSYGKRTSPTTWTLPANSTSPLMIWTTGPLPVLSLTAQWVDPQSNEAFASTAITIGTDADDTIDSAYAGPYVDGRGGIDTIVLSHAVEQYEFQRVDELTVAVRYDNALLQHLFDVEYVQFGEQRFALAELAEDAGVTPDITPGDGDEPPPEPEVDSGPAAEPEPELEAEPEPEPELERDVALEPELDAEDGRILDAKQSLSARSDPFPSINMLPLSGQATAGVAPQMPKRIAIGTVSSAGPAVRVPVPRPSVLGQMHAGSGQAESPQGSASKSNVPSAKQAERNAKASDGEKPAGEAKNSATAAASAPGMADDPALVGQLADSVVQASDPRLSAVAPAQVAKMLPRVAAQTMPAPPRLHRVYSGAMQLNTAGPTAVPNAGSGVVAGADASLAMSATLPSTPPADFASQWLTVTPAFDSQLLFEQIDEVQSQTLVAAEDKQLVAGTAVVLATGFSLAQIVWLLRGSVLITKLMSSMPIWFAFDPLPILNSCHRLALPEQTDPDASLPDDSLLDIATQ